MAPRPGPLTSPSNLCPRRSSPECCAALRQYRQQQLPLAGVTVSTDAYGSLPVFDEQGRLIGYDVADPGGPGAAA